MTTLETDQLTIRNFTVDDAPALHEMIGQYQASPYAAYDQQWPTSAEEIKGVAKWFADGDSYLAVCLKDTGTFIGFVCLNPQERTDRCEFNLGYIFNFDYHGHGYATEACRAAIDHAFADLGADRLVTGTAEENQPSCQLLARLGFRRVRESTGSFAATEDGEPIKFVGHDYELDRADRQADGGG